VKRVSSRLLQQPTDTRLSERPAKGRCSERLDAFQIQRGQIQPPSQSVLPQTGYRIGAGAGDRMVSNTYRNVPGPGGAVPQGPATTTAKWSPSNSEMTSRSSSSLATRSPPS
jgi:hypothetical protein